MTFVEQGTFAATVVVTLSPDRGGNFYCSGAADQVEINAAIVYCAAIGGGEVVLGQGGFVLAAQVTIPANVLLRGMGWTTILNYDAGGNCITFTGDNAKLRDLKIVITAGAGAGGSRPNGIYASGRTNLEVSGIWHVGDQTVADDGSDFRQCGVVMISTTLNCRIFNNTIGNNDRHSIYMGADCDYNSVTDNNCQGNTEAGVWSVFADYNVISNNILTANKFGISLETSHNNTITGNYIKSNDTYGITVQHSDYNAITGNICTLSGWFGMLLTDAHHNNVIGNTCNDNVRNGLNIADANNITITGNTIYGNGFSGLRLTGNSCTVVGNSCNGNDSGNTNTYSGIQITTTASDNIIHSNTCNDNDKYGIDIDNANCDRNWVKNNTLRGNGAGAFNDIGTDTKTPFINVLAPSPDAFIGTHAVQQMADGIDSIIRFEVPIPREYQETVTAEAVLVAAAAGNIRTAVATNWAQIGSAEDYNANTDSIAAGQTALLINDMSLLDISAAFTAIAGEDWIGVEFTREASNVLDTVGAAVYFVGFRLRYV